MEYWDLYDSERKPLNRVHARGEAFAEGEYYVCAEVWVRNSKGQFLITKRHPDKKAGNLWEFTGGGTLAGESTLQSAVRELKEETGIDASEAELRLFVTYQKKNYFLDLFLLNKDIDIVNHVTGNAGIATIKKLCDGFEISIRDFFNDDLFDDLEQEVR
ncbi:MAG: NUDIX domain-containing protein [Lachnospiraceae bacterium]|nr:NUDIX domain-containing protein [Lachnospiraceae bacterium]